MVQIHCVQTTTRNRFRTTGAALLLLLVMGSAGSNDATPPVIAAASSLQSAMRDLADAFEASTGKNLRLAFGGSGNLYRQIRQGAPFQAFFSADESYVDRLSAAGFLEGQGRVYALGRLALIVPDGSPLAADRTLADLSAAVKDGRLRRFAIANPAHAPYGERAREVLVDADLWIDMEPKLVMGENVAQAAQFAVNGATQGGLVASSLVAALAQHHSVDSTIIPAARHSPLNQKAGLRTGAGDTARAFLDFVLGDAGQDILAEHGFEPADGIGGE